MSKVADFLPSHSTRSLSRICSHSSAHGPSPPNVQLGEDMQLCKCLFHFPERFCSPISAASLVEGWGNSAFFSAAAINLRLGCGLRRLTLSLCSSSSDSQLLFLRFLFVWPQELLWVTGATQTSEPAWRGILRPPSSRANSIIN